jgi:Domain of unknown function (DUF4465)/Secretion system C-terminal sorting domain
MKIKITTLGLAIASFFTQAQTIADFESFTLAPNSAYSPTLSTPFQTSNAVFEYAWDNSFGGYWSDGFAYTNKQDSANGTFTNLYGVKALKGYTNSATYVVGMNYATIKIKSPFDVINSFYITNTTYAYKTIKNGDSFSRKFGDTTGTKSGTTIAQGSYPDFFKITAKGYKNGSLKPDSSVFYLADYRFANNTQDYIVKTWQWFNIANLGSVDSIQFFMYSSDNSSFGMNTPAFFALDNFATTLPNFVNVSETKHNLSANVFPNPCNNTLFITDLKKGEESTLKMTDVSGRKVYEETVMEENKEIKLEALLSGVYFLEITTTEGKSIKRIIKN